MTPTNNESRDVKKEELKKEIQEQKAELKTIMRDLIKARDMSEQRYLKQRQKQVEMNIKRLNAQMKEL